MVAFLLVVGLAAEYIPGGPQLSSGLGAVLLLEQIRRLHDFGRSGWWAVAATFAPLIVVIPVMLTVSLAVGLIVALVSALVLLVWIGAIRGDTDENRFGPVPTFSLGRLATRR
jgi:uncharacterized membrane protein YhaH (DUF805 family)